MTSFSIYTYPRMKRRDLIKQIQDAANTAGIEFVSLRNSSGHEVFSLDGLRIPYPTIVRSPQGTARSILRQAAAKLGEEWWT